MVMATPVGTCASCGEPVTQGCTGKISHVCRFDPLTVEAEVVLLRSSLKAVQQALAEAANEINCAGPVAHRIRVLKQEWQAEIDKIRTNAAERVREAQAALEAERETGRRLSLDSAAKIVEIEALKAQLEVQRRVATACMEKLGTDWEAAYAVERKRADQLEAELQERNEKA